MIGMFYGTLIQKLQNKFFRNVWTSFYNTILKCPMFLDTFENYCKECQDVSCPPKIYVFYAQLWELEFI